MKNLWKTITIYCLLIVAVIITGCTRKELYPASDVQITKADPFSILPTSDSFDSISDGTISMKLLNSVPCELVSFDVHYKTILDEPIDGITMSNIKANLPLSEEGTEVSFEIKVYSQNLLNIFNSSTSNISPVRATVTLHFIDVNKNDIYKEASFLLYKYEATSSE